MKSVSHTHAFDVASPIDELFALFGPEGEKLWVPGWDYDNVMGTTELGEDYVFTTAAHDHGTTTAIWVVKRYEPRAHRIELIRVEPGDKVGIVKVHCTALSQQSTRVEVTYTYTALSAAGEQFVASFGQPAYTAFIEEWRALLARYFEREPR